jgi:hypothetical protein
MIKTDDDLIQIMKKVENMLSVIENERGFLAVEPLYVKLVAVIENSQEYYNIKVTLSDDEFIDMRKMEQDFLISMRIYERLVQRQKYSLNVDYFRDELIGYLDMVMKVKRSKV